MLGRDGQLVLQSGAEASHRSFIALYGEEQQVFGLGTEEQHVSVIGKEQQAFELDATLEPDQGWPVAGSGASFCIRSRLVEEQHVFGPAVVRQFIGDGIVGSMTQQEGNLIFSISAQRHSARSRAALHRARELWSAML